MPEARKQLAHLEKTDKKKHKRVRKALGLLERDPKYPGLRSHQLQTKTGPNGQPLWEAYVENNTPAAFRIFYCYDIKRRGIINVVTITAHP